MKFGRRPAAGTVTAMIAAMENASKPDLRPPRHCPLRKGDRPFWRAIIRARARDEWAEPDLVVAAQLARLMADIEREQKLLDGEDAVIQDPRGKKMQNPRVGILSAWRRDMHAYMRALRMSGAVLGDIPALEPAREAERQAREALGELDADDRDGLLAH